jgi:Anti-sigma-K factor rskA
VTDAGSDPRLDDAELAALLADPAAWAEPDEALAERVVGAVSAAGSATPALRSARRTRRWVAPVVAAAVGAAAAAVIAVVAWPQSAEAPSAEREAPAGDTLQMVGTDLAPLGDGTAVVGQRESGWAISLSIPDLPRLGGGEFYQVWVADCDGRSSVPGGSFFDLREAVGWVGVPMDEFPRVSVTRESLAPGADVGQASSGQVVSTGVYGSCP